MDYGEAVNEFEEFFSEQYYKEVSEAVKDGEGSIVVDFQDLDMFSFDVTDYLRDNPENGVTAAEEGLQAHDQVTDEEMTVRFSNFPEEDFVLLKNLRSEHICKFVPIEGMIKRASQVKPEVVSAIFECVQCGDVYEKEQDSSKLKSPYKCDCGSKKFDVQEKIMTDTQVVTLEENPESREGSEQPTSLSVRLEGDLVDPEFQKRVVPGNVVEVTGQMRETPLQKDSKKYDIYMEANHVNPTQQEFEQLELTQEEIDEIKTMSKQDDIFQQINDSIAPSIYGHDRIKEAIALQMFGGVKKTRDDGIKSRGDLHILLIGEPGTGKCVAPDTEIISAEGERHQIGELVNNRIESSNEVKEIDDGVYVEEEIETLGMDDKGKIEKKKSSKMWKRDAPEKMFKIKTSSGREVEVTPSHPLFTQKDGNIIAKKAENLSQGHSIAAPREKLADVKIEQVANSDIFWDKIESIEQFEPEYDYVYDLEIPKHHNYISNGILSHNSQLLKFTGEIAPKGRYVVGKSSSGAGLTASVVKEESTGEFSLEAGAVVLAHKGMAAIDEIDKMDKEDRSSLHEAMEQQCFAPGTEVLMADGSKKPISDIVDPIIERNQDLSDRSDKEVASVDEDLTVVSTDTENFETGEEEVSVVGRREAPDKMLRIELSSGRSLEVTKEHPFYQVRDGGLTEVEAQNLQEKGFVIAPRELPIEGEEQSLENRKELEGELDKLESLVGKMHFIKINNIEEFEPEYDEVYDLTVPDNNNFVAENIVAHNSISVSKANIQATLNAETSILAAGNPKLGRFDPYEPVPEQISIGDTLLSRFDFIFPVMDEPDKERDTELADAILQNHIEPEETNPAIEGERLRKYIAYAKKNKRPQLTREASDKIQEFYVSMRQKGDDEGGGVPITARQLEATVRTAEAAARAKLKDEVEVEDAEQAIDLLTYSLKLVGMDPETGEFDIDMIESGVSSSQRNRLQTVKHIIEELADGDSAEIEAVLERADEEGIAEDKAEEIIEKLKREGELFEPQQGHVQKI